VGGETRAVNVEHDVEARMRDGTVLRADVYRPRTSELLPVILQRLPYDKRTAHTIHYASPEWYAGHGYIVVVQDTRGRWSSDGQWYPFRYERLDGFDSVQWAAGLPGSNGKVGMYGASYGGATQLFAATASPSALSFACPAFTSADYFDGWTYEGGALNLAFVVYWALNLATDTARRNGDYQLLRELTNAYRSGPIQSLHSFMPLRDLPLLKESGVLDYYFDWLAHDTNDAYWNGIANTPHFKNVKAGALHISGWYDSFLAGTTDSYSRLMAESGSTFAREHQRMMIGPWMHLPWSPIVGQADFGPGAASSIIDDTQLRYFNWLLKDIDDGIRSEPPIKLFVMGQNVWRNESKWPLDRANETALYLHSDGRANSFLGDGVLSLEKPTCESSLDRYVYDPNSASSSLGGHSCCRESLAPQGAFDQRMVERFKDMLCYTSARLAISLEVTGPVRMLLWAASSAPDTDWVAKLIDVYPDGRAMNITQGILRARYRESLVSPTPIEIDSVYEYVVDMRATSIVFAAGHRIRVDVSSSSFPHWDRNSNTGHALGVDGLADLVPAKQAVFHDLARPSHLIVPVVGPSVAFLAADEVDVGA
jgi:uncharacterized protein